jgi:hypothetical protein
MGADLKAHVANLGHEIATWAGFGGGNDGADAGWPGRHRASIKGGAAVVA